MLDSDLMACSDDDAKAAGKTDSAVVAYAAAVVENFVASAAAFVVAIEFVAVAAAAAFVAVDGAIPFVEMLKHF